MKKIISLILATALLCACTLTLASCGELKLEGTYQGSFFTDEDDIITVTIRENNVAELSLLKDGVTKKVTGTYKIVAEEGHGHETITFDIKGDIGYLSLMQNVDYVYELAEVDGQKQLTLSVHGTSTSMVLTEVKK